MLEFSLSQLNGIGSKILSGLRNIAFNVLGHAGYGQSKKWSEDAPKPKYQVPGKLEYFEAIQSVVMNIAMAAIVSPRLLLLPFWPEWVK
jgi:hypothetical protein